ncbi:MAG: leucine-rich repeat protein [Lachnospiraceae bacterium]|nr:leucine-rich repeat protein [Lachnospiraceae bacterium]
MKGRNRSKKMLAFLLAVSVMMTTVYVPGVSLAEESVIVEDISVGAETGTASAVSEDSGLENTDSGDTDSGDSGTGVSEADLIIEEEEVPDSLAETGGTRIISWTWDDEYEQLEWVEDETDAQKDSGEEKEDDGTWVLSLAARSDGYSQDTLDMLFPWEILAVMENSEAEVTVAIDEWHCEDYAADAEGRWPAGEESYEFTAQLADGFTTDEEIVIRVEFTQAAAEDTEDSSEKQSEALSESLSESDTETQLETGSETGSESETAAEDENGIAAASETAVGAENGIAAASVTEGEPEAGTAAETEIETAAAESETEEATELLPELDEEDIALTAEESDEDEIALIAEDSDESDSVGGSITEDIFWNLSGGVLCISGSGRMPDFSSGEAPWAEYADEVLSIVVGLGITYVGSYSFGSMANAELLILSNSVTAFGAHAVTGCTALTELTLSENVASLGTQAFFGCTALTSVTLYNSSVTIGSQALGYADSATLTSGCTLYGYQDSTAQTYAEGNGLSFEALDTELLSIGSVSSGSSEEAESGTVYKIETAEDFLAIYENPDGDYVLTADIDFSEYGSFSVPEGVCFSGTLYGQGHTLSNLTINQVNVYSCTYGKSYSDGQTDGFAGLFDTVSGTIQDLKLENVSIDIPSDASAYRLHVGTIAGVLYGNAAVINCSVSGKITVSGGENVTQSIHIGGIAGSLLGISGYGYVLLDSCNVGVDITASSASSVYASGIVSGFDYYSLNSFASLKDCSYDGSMDVSQEGENADAYFAACGSTALTDCGTMVVGAYAYWADSCTVKGSIQVTTTDGYAFAIGLGYSIGGSNEADVRVITDSADVVTAIGILSSRNADNHGNVKLDAGEKSKGTASVYGVHLGSSCSNYADVSASAVYYFELYAAGVRTLDNEECTSVYNYGNISVSVQGGYYVYAYGICSYQKMDGSANYGLVTVDDLGEYPGMLMAYAYGIAEPGGNAHAVNNKYCANYGDISVTSDNRSSSHVYAYAYGISCCTYSRNYASVSVFVSQAGYLYAGAYGNYGDCGENYGDIMAAGDSVNSSSYLSAMGSQGEYSYNEGTVSVTGGSEISCSAWGSFGDSSYNEGAVSVTCDNVLWIYGSNGEASHNEGTVSVACISLGSVCGSSGDSSYNEGAVSVACDSVEYGSVYGSYGDSSYNKGTVFVTGDSGTNGRFYGSYGDNSCNMGDVEVTLASSGTCRLYGSCGASSYNAGALSMTDSENGDVYGYGSYGNDSYNSGTVDAYSYSGNVYAYGCDSDAAGSTGAVTATSDSPQRSVEVIAANSSEVRAIHTGYYSLSASNGTVQYYYNLSVASSCELHKFQNSGYIILNSKDKPCSACSYTLSGKAESISSGTVAAPEAESDEWTIPEPEDTEDDYYNLSLGNIALYENLSDMDSRISRLFYACGSFSYTDSAARQGLTVVKNADLTDFDTVYARVSLYNLCSNICSDVYLSITLPEGLSFSPDVYEPVRTYSVGDVEGTLDYWLKDPIYLLYSEKYDSAQYLTYDWTLQWTTESGELKTAEGTSKKLVSLTQRYSGDKNQALLKRGYETDVSDEVFTWSASGLEEDCSSFQKQIALLSAYMSEMMESSDKAALRARIRYNLLQLGFSHIYYGGSSSGYMEEYVCAKKKVIGSDGKVYTVVLLAVQGSDSLRDWLGNFSYDFSGTVHSNLVLCGKNNLYDLYDYLGLWEGTEIGSDTKLLITGHSRGGSIANYVGAYFDRLSQSAASNVYCYTFAAPNLVNDGTQHSGIYDNIFNLINYEDVVPFVPGDLFKYGRTLVFNYPNETAKDYQAVVRGISSATASLSSLSILAEYGALLWANAEAMGAAHDMSNYIDNLKTGTADYNAYDTVTGELDPIIESWNEKDRDLYQEELEDHPFLRGLATDLAWLSALAVQVFLNIDSGTGYSGTPPYILVQGAVLKGEDLYKLLVHCPVDVEILDADGSMLCKIVNNELTEYDEDSGITVLISGDEKELFLPDTGTYQVKITGYDDGTMDYSLIHVDSDGNDTVAYNYYNLPVSSGVTTVAAIPSGDMLSSDTAVLSGASGEILTPDETLSGSELNTVEVTLTSDEGCSVLAGAGSYTRGDYVSVLAVGTGSRSFLGWYDTETETRLSTEEWYSFQAQENISLTARFEETSDEETSDEETSGGETSGEETSGGDTSDGDTSGGEIPGEEISAIALSGCEISLSGTAYTYDGTAKTPSVTVSYDGIMLTEGTDYTTEYADNTDAGTATVTVTGTGNYTGTVQKTFTIAKAEQAITVQVSESSIQAGATTSMTVSGASGAVSYASSDTSVAAVSANGVVTGKKPGTVTITVTAAETSNYRAAAGRTVSVTVTLASCQVSSLKNTSRGITVKWNEVTGATGYYVYRKTGSGSYKKIKTITAASTVSYTDTSVKSRNGTSYTYKVTAYSGSTTSGFKAKKIVRLSVPTLSIVKSTSSKKLTVKWKKKSKVTGYQIQYSTSSTFKSSRTVTVKGAAKVSKVLSSLKKGKKYYVRIRTYYKSGGTTYYSAWTAKKSAKVKK